MLGVGTPGIDDDFFLLGGDSLAAVRLTNALKREMSVEMTIKEVFDHPTIRLLADHIEAGLPQGLEEGEL